ncbi:Protein GrpE [Bienertia sinuspersici]
MGGTIGSTENLIPNFYGSSLSSPSTSYTSSNSFTNFLATSAQKHFNGDQNEIESHRPTVSSADYVFGSVPNRLEVEYAIAAFQSFMMQGLSSSMSILDRIQLLLNHQDPRILRSSTGFQRVYDAFHLLQTVPSVRRMIVSISCDKSVWDAVLRNDEVQEFRKSLNQAEASKSGVDSDFASAILDNMKLRIWQLIETLKSLLVNKSYESSQIKNTNTELKQGFEEMIVSTVLLSTIILMIVLVIRAYGA